MKSTNLSFRSRIVLSFIFFIIITMLSGIIAIYEIVSVGKYTQLLYEHPFTVRNNLGVINVGTIALHRATEEVAYAETYDAIDKAKIDVWRTDSLTNIAFSVIEKQFLGNKKDVEKAKLAYISLFVSVNKIIELKESGHDKESKKFAREIVIYRLKKLDFRLRILSDFAENKAKEFYQNSRETSENSLILLIIILITTP